MRLCFGLMLSCACAFAQPAPQFEVADVHHSPAAVQSIAQGPFFAGGRYELRFVTMLDLIRIAYAIDPERVYGGPSWLEMDRFDVFAKVPPGSTAESRRQMLQSLLAGRFRLVVKNDSKPVPVWGLSARKPQLKEADPSGEAGCNFIVQNQPSAPPSPGQPITLPVIQYTCKNVTMASLATRIPDLAGAGAYLNNRLVVDQTELKGAYDLVLRFTPKVPAGIQTVGEPIPLADALDKQLGLKLEPTTAPMPVFHVASVDRLPTPNPAEALKSFPPLPTEFEVVDLKPVDPKAPRAPAQPSIRNGRVYLPGINLKNLIQIAWDLNGDELLINAPKWMDEDRYDILAKAPAAVPLGDFNPQRNGLSINLEALRPMFKAVVIDRFQLAAHMEERPVNTYTLTASKPRLKKADPASRTRWQEGVDPDSKSKYANSVLGRLVTCQNVSMQQFADLLPNIAPGYLHTRVVDATNLEGGYDFTFTFSPIGAVNAAARPRSDGEGNTDAAQDNSGTISLFDAIAKQLGLKLETQKRPTPVLVIDKVERKPTEN
jgi:uncharacterized protein (TIGR03435 family)